MKRWRVRRTDSFFKELKHHKSNHELLKALGKKIPLLLENPQEVGGRLSGNLHGKKNTRLIKNFRLIFEIRE